MAGGFARSRFRTSAGGRALHVVSLGLSYLVNSCCNTFVSIISLISPAALLGSGGAEPALRFGPHNSLDSRLGCHSNILSSFHNAATPVPSKAARTVASVLAADRAHKRALGDRRSALLHLSVRPPIRLVSSMLFQ